jgi:hypothetical protein
MRSFSPRLTASRIQACALLLATVLLALPTALWAQAGGDVATAAVVRFDDKTGRNSELLEVKATDAVALALADSKEFLVTPAREVDREIKALALTPPLSETEATRLGKRLDVDSICYGDILAATVDTRTGKGDVKLQIMMLNVEAAEVLDGATVDVATKAVPGWSGTEADILNEALREAAEQGVARTLATRVRRGTVEAVLPSGTSEINLGSQDGAAPGMKLVVMRPVYLRELETVTLRKLGYLEISRIQPDICYADPLRDVAPRTGDYVLRVYQPYVEVKAEAAKKDRSNLFWGGLTAFALLGLVGIATGTNEGSEPLTPISYLHQDSMGDVPRIRVELPQWDRAFAHLLFRGPSRAFPAEPYWLQEVSTRGMGEENIKQIDDLPDAYPQKTRTITVSFRNEDGDPETAEVECIWVHTQLDPGSTHYHRVQRVTKPQFPPGTNPPIGNAGGTDNVFQGPDENEINQDYEFPMIGQATQPCGPVTFILPPQLISPAPNPLPQGTNAITFEWAPSVGADEYMVEVFADTDPNGLGQPIFRRTGIRPRGATTISETWNPSAGDLEADSFYYWRVGARKGLEIGSGGQGVPRVGYSPNEVTGYVLSVMRSFPTAPIPPGPLSAKGDRTGPVPGIGTPSGVGLGTSVDDPPARGGRDRKPKPDRRPGKPPRGGFASPGGAPVIRDGGWGTR